MALHVLAALSVAAVFAAALRLSSQFTSVGLERVVVAATAGAAALVVQALALGLFGLVRYPAAVAATAAVTWLLAWRLLPAAEPAPLQQLAAAWVRMPPRRRAVAGALAGAAAAWVLWPLREPVVGYDGISYHMPEVLAWVASGRPGAVDRISYLFPFGNYPVTNEVALTWLTSASRGFAFAAVWTPLLHVLLALAGWLGLRRIDVPPLAAGLAVAALWLMPLTVLQAHQPSTDLAALTWTVVTAALAAAAARNRRLLPFAVVAAGLAIGTKTSSAPLTVIALVAALAASRVHLRALARPLALATLVAVVVGGVWYLRNLLTHGSPLYPFVETPGGDPPPPVWQMLDHSLLERPAETLRGREREYVEAFAGALVLMAAAVVLPLLIRVRAVLLAGAAAIGSMFLWANAPSTGVPDAEILEPNVITTTRYALPALAAVALVPAVAARQGRRAAALASGVLAVAIAWNLFRVAEIGAPRVPPIWWMAAIAAVAAGGAAAIRALPLRGRRAPIAVALAVTAAGLVLGQQAGGYVQRLTPNVNFFSTASVTGWFSTQPGFHDDDRPIAIAGHLVSPLGGNRLSHKLTLIGPEESCEAIRARTADGWVVITDDPVLEMLVPVPGVRCFDGIKPAFANGGVRVFGRAP